MRFFWDRVFAALEQTYSAVNVQNIYTNVELGVCYQKKPTAIPLYKDGKSLSTKQNTNCTFFQLNELFL